MLHTFPTYHDHVSIISNCFRAGKYIINYLNFSFTMVWIMIAIVCKLIQISYGSQGVIGLG